MTRIASRRAASLLDIDLGLRADDAPADRDITPEASEDVQADEAYPDVEQTLAKIASIIRGLVPETNS